MDPRGIFRKVQRKEDKKDFVFALEIGYGIVRGAIWAVDEGKTKVFSLSEAVVWEEEGDLVEAADMAFSEAVGKATISEEDEPKKVIFGLPHAWVEGEKVVPEKLKRLKKICQGLDLKPVGFVVTIEAIVKYLKTLEGVSPNIILANLSSKQVEVTLLRSGKILGPSFVNRSDNLGEDIAGGLSQLGGEEVLPTRIIVYDSGKEIEGKKEEVLSYPWLEEGKNFNFLHLPKVEVAPPDFDIKAVALAGGAEVAKAEGIAAEIFLEEKPAEAKEEPPEEDEAKKAEKEEVFWEETREIAEKKSPPEEVSGEKDPSKDEEKLLPIKKPVGLGFGFMKGKDVTAEEKPPDEPLKEPLKVETQSPEGQRAVDFPQPMVGIQAVERQPFEEKPKTPLKGRFKIPRPKIDLTKIFSPFRKLFSLIRRPTKLPLLGIILGVFFVLLVGGIFAFWWLIPKVEVILTVKPQVLEKEFKITLDSGAASPDREGMVIPAKVVEATIDGEMQVETTGTKIIGDEAKGEVIIYNRTMGEKTLVKGTVLTGPGDLQFVLDEEVVVASESAGPDYATVPGKATVAVTAVAIGSEGNLASGTEFDVDKFSTTDFIARNDAAFSGGTSREIRIVSESDQEDLLNSLLAQLQAEAGEKLTEKINPADSLVEESLTEKISKKSFDKDVKEEAERLRLELGVKFSALSYQKAELNSFVKEKIKDAVSSGFEFKEEESEISFELSEVIDEEKVLFIASFKADLWPKIDQDQIRNNLRGKKPDIGEYYLSRLPNISGYKITFTPQLPPRLKTFPRVLKNIKIEVISQ